MSVTSAVGSASAVGSDSADASASADATESAAARPEPVPLLKPADGVPEPVTTDQALAELAAGLAAGTGPIAIDTERASGFRYGSRAFLVQIRRAGTGTALLDPVPFASVEPLAEPLQSGEWILHAATQDLPCLAELGLRPASLFDTELAGRLAGLPHVSLGSLTEEMLGLHLAKGHGADDWSIRPLPQDLLVYAALDVEVLIELRAAMVELLRGQGKLEWAEQEFAAIVAAPQPEPKPDPWRRTSGIHAIKDRRTLAVVRELWRARDDRARQRDLSPHRVLPDRAIVDAATAAPASAAQLVKLPVFRGRMQRQAASYWFAAIERARELPESELPPRRLRKNGPPSPSNWERHRPDAAARLTYARAALAELSEKVSVPVENLASPHLVRAVLWEPPTSAGISSALQAGGARPWQVELVSPILRAALDARA